MKLQDIIIYNRAPFGKFELHFEQRNIIILSGINGRGKTTVNSYIADAIYELAKKAFANQFENIHNKYYRVSSKLYSLKKEDVSFVYFRFITDDGTNADYIDIDGKCSNELYETIINIDNPIKYSAIESALNKNGVTKHWSINDKNKISDLFYNNLISYFPAYRFEIPSYLNSPYTVELKYKTKSDFSGYLPNQIEVTSDLNYIGNWIMDIILDSLLYKDETNALVQQLNQIISAILYQKTRTPVRLGIGKRNNGAERISVIDVNSSKCIYPSIFNMSSGELALLCLFGELLKQSDKISKPISNVTGIVLIDEIDKHLHIKLQKETLPKLIKLFPNIQFIITSHSPFLSLGISDEESLSYSIYDFDNSGLCCSLQNNAIYNELYELIVSENRNFAKQYNELTEKIKDNTKPLVITEGKTDWKHLKAALKALKINDLDVEFYEYDESLGDDTLYKLLNDYARIRQSRIIIGVLDRDNSTMCNSINVKDKDYKDFGNNVFAFSIPIVNQDIYGVYTSIEHYYQKKDLQKETIEKRRLFLGDEFYASCNSKDGNYQTKIKQLQHKIAVNGVIDDKVYKTEDLEQKNSVALSKSDFANLILNDELYSKDFDFSKFAMIFEIIKKICSENSSI